MPKNEVNRKGDPKKHGLKGCAVACHRKRQLKRKVPLSTCLFWTHRTLYSKEGSTPPDSWEGRHVPGLMMCAWLEQYNLCRAEEADTRSWAQHVAV